MELLKVTEKCFRIPFECHYRCTAIFFLYLGPVGLLSSWFVSVNMGASWKRTPVRTLRKLRGYGPMP